MNLAGTAGEAPSTGGTAIGTQLPGTQPPVHSYRTARPAAAPGRRGCQPHAGPRPRADRPSDGMNSGRAMVRREHGPARRSRMRAGAPALPAGSSSLRLRRSDGLSACARTSTRPMTGKVVSLDHGCGAHSEAITPIGPFGTIAPVVDELGYDLRRRAGHLHVRDCLRIAGSRLAGLLARRAAARRGCATA